MFITICNKRATLTIQIEIEEAILLLTNPHELRAAKTLFALKHKLKLKNVPYTAAALITYDDMHASITIVS